MPEDHAFPPDTILVDRYEVGERLGDRNRSRTYRAIDHEANRDVALKVLRVDELSDWVEMEAFEREIAVLRGLNHPNIPAFHDSFRTTVDGREYLVLVIDFLPGDNLATIISSGRRISEKDFRSLVTTVLEVLTYIHELHPPLLHLSVAPENLILSRRWYLVDFDATGGIARGSESAGMTGIAAFTAPEVSAGEPAIQSDLYSLGKCLQFVLTGTEDGDLSALPRKPGNRTVEFVRTLTQEAPGRRYSTARAALAFFKGKTSSTSAGESSKARKEQLARKKKRRVRWKKALKKPVRTVAIILPFAIAGFFLVRGVTVAVRVKLHGPVVEAAVQGNVVELEELLEAGRTPNARNESGITALNQALLYQQTRTARMLIDAGADVNRTTRIESPAAGPALSIASLYGLTDFVGLLCEAGADPNVRDYEGSTPLGLCIARGDTAAVQALIDAGADLEFRDASGVPPLMLAVHEEQLACAVLLVEAGARLDTQRTGDTYTVFQAVAAMSGKTDPGGRSDWVALIDAMAVSPSAYEFHSEHVNIGVLTENLDDYQTVELLLDPEADIDRADGSGSTALIRAVADEKTATAETLLLLGADPDIGDRDDLSALVIAREAGNAQMAALLVAHDASEPVTERNLIAAARVGDIAAVEYLLDQGVPADAVDARGNTVFMSAVVAGDETLMDVVESHGGGGTVPDSFILDMVRNNYYAGVRTLLGRGYNLDIASTEEGTTLDIAVSRGYVDMARMLRDAGVSHALSPDGLSRQISRGNLPAVQAYLALEFNPDAADSYGMTPMMEAASRGYVNIIDALVASGADVNVQKATGESALSMAIASRESETARRLLELGADPNISFQTGWSDRRGNTPLELANYLRMRSLANLLVEYGAR